MTKTLPVLYAGCSVLMIQWEHGTYTHPFGSEDKTKQNKTKHIKAIITQRKDCAFKKQRIIMLRMNKQILQNGKAESIPFHSMLSYMFQVVHLRLK